MHDSNLLKKLKSILAQNLDRTGKATRITEAIRDEGAYRWVGIYDVDIQRGMY
jgi:L-methionine (R)-S-oxide reductase